MAAVGADRFRPHFLAIEWDDMVDAFKSGAAVVAPEWGSEKGTREFFNSVPWPMPGYTEAMKMKPPPG